MTRLGDVIRRLLGRRPVDPHQLLVQDIDRTRGFMRAVIESARRLDVPVPAEVMVSTVAWRDWSDQIQEQQP